MLCPLEAEAPENDVATARHLAAGYVGESFRASLETREAVEFLLTPAILVQEAISEHLFQTYPME